MTRNNMERVPMMLQLFAEPGPTPPAPEPPAPNPPSPEPPAPKDEPKSFDDILKDSKYQEEYDRRLKAELSAQESRLKVLFDEKATEAEKLAKMTDDEKAEYKRQKREKELQEREMELTKRELMAVAKSTLIEKELPASLAELLNYSDADSCNKSILALEKAFKQAVQAQVDKKLEGGKPPKKAPQDETVTKEQFAKFGYKERLELKTKNPELYKQLSGK